MYYLCSYIFAHYQHYVLKKLMCSTRYTCMYNCDKQIYLVLHAFRLYTVIRPHFNGKFKFDSDVNTFQ